MPYDDSTVFIGKDLCFGYGSRPVLKNLTLRLSKGKVVALVGSNGAGKTTLMNLISGYLMPQSGQLQFQGIDYAGWSAPHIARMGVARSFQDMRLCSELNAIDHLLLAHHKVRGECLPFAWLHSYWKAENDAHTEDALTTLNALGISSQTARQPLKELSYGQLRMVGFACAIGNAPKLILLDEPTSGVAEAESEKIVERLLTLRRAGATLLVIEHNLEIIRKIADETVLLEDGRVLIQGPTEDVLDSAEFKSTMFGESYDGNS